MGRDIRNIAIIAHVDHGKTTLVDAMLRQSGIFRINEQVAERVMDSNDLERERGITILSKNTSVQYADTRINIVDTPGHADFAGEVERVLGMVEGVLLLVDAFEGPMPQTRFVLRKALELNLKPIVVVNKIDRPEARPGDVVNDIADLFIDLEATDDQMEFPVIYASSREGYAQLNENDEEKNLRRLFEVIINEVPPPKSDVELPFRMLISNIDYDDYVGRIAVGKVDRGQISYNAPVAICKKDGAIKNGRVGKLYVFDGLKRVEVESVSAGDIVLVAGLEDFLIGETICAPELLEPLPVITVDEPTISMNFLVNNSPFAGREGTFVTSRHLKDRLFKETETNVSLQVEETDSTDCFKVSGRGELHISILIETMRREGYEFQVSKPEVIFKEENGVILEPMENLEVDIPDEAVGSIIEKLSLRKAEMLNLHTGVNGYTKIEFKIPSRGLIGYRNEFLTDTKGNGVMNSWLCGYEPHKGEISGRQRGSIIVWEDGETVAYGLYNAQERGELFVGPGVLVYTGMVVGQNAKNEDIVLNVCKKKHVTNIRASGSDDALKLTPPKELSLEQCLEFIAEDELVEVTPVNIRLRKKILNSDLRKRAKKA